MSLVNVSLKLKMLILQIHCYFLLEKCENLLQHIFQTKNYSVFDNVVGIHLTRCRVPTSSGNHGKPGKSQIKIPCMEKSWNLIEAEKSWKNHGIL